MSRGERIRRYRKMKGLTQKSLAERIGLAESAVRNYELGLRDPSQETLAALSGALGVPSGLRTPSASGPWTARRSRSTPRRRAPRS